MAGALVVALLLGTVWAVRLVGLVRDVGRYADHWSQPRGQTGGLLYVALGDSAAQGIGASTPDRGYVGLLAERVRERTSRSVEVVNLSSSGARIGDVLDTQLPALPLEEWEDTKTTLHMWAQILGKTRLADPQFRWRASLRPDWLLRPAN